jgi:hypothetical protein
MMCLLSEQKISEVAFPIGFGNYPQPLLHSRRLFRLSPTVLTLVSSLGDSRELFTIETLFIISVFHKYSQIGLTEKCKPISNDTPG